MSSQLTGDHGETLDEKEAFRHQSHVFHGKGSGKVKSEKRKKKREEKEKLSKNSSGDTPLGTLELLKKRMEETGSAHVVMSGARVTT